MFIDSITFENFKKIIQNEEEEIKVVVGEKKLFNYFLGADFYYIKEGK